MHHIFIGLHHDYFKNGYERLTDFVDELNTRSKNVKWDSLGNIVRSFVSANEVDFNLAGIDLSGLTLNGHKKNTKIFPGKYFEPKGF